MNVKLENQAERRKHGEESGDPDGKHRPERDIPGHHSGKYVSKARKALEEETKQTLYTLDVFMRNKEMEKIYG